MQHPDEAQSAQRQALLAGKLGCHVGESSAEADRDGVHVRPAFAGVAVQTLAQVLLY